VSELSSQWWTDDDRLLAALDDALGTAHAVPPEFVEAGKAAYAWRTIDAELAALTYDSATDAELVTATRAEPATLRALTFASAGLTIDLEVTPDEILGQFSPEQPGQVTAYAGTLAADDEPGTTDVGTAAVDELGFFIIRPLPVEPFRLLCRTTSGLTVLTGWVSP
jgi:hypothetical protein